jgi:hypothetical protein
VVAKLLRSWKDHDHCRLRFTKPSEAYYMRALSEKSALVAQPGRAKVS